MKYEGEYFILFTVTDLSDEAFTSAVANSIREERTMFRVSVHMIGRKACALRYHWGTDFDKPRTANYYNLSLTETICYDTKVYGIPVFRPFGEFIEPVMWQGSPSGKFGISPRSDADYDMLGEYTIDMYERLLTKHTPKHLWSIVNIYPNSNFNATFYQS